VIKIRKTKMDGACGKYGKQERCTQKSLVGHIIERPLGIRRLVWGNNIKKDLQEMGAKWIHVD